MTARLSPLVRACSRAVVALAALSAACGSPRALPSTLTPARIAPSAPVPDLALPRPPGDPSGPTVSGIVLVTTEDGTSPLAGAWVYSATRDTWGAVKTDRDGRYVVPVPQSDRWRLHAVRPAGSGQLFQRAVVVPGARGTGDLNIELVPANTRGVQFGSPTLSGVVYRMTEAGPRPWAHSPVSYGSFPGPWYDAYVETDENGRYEFGRLPLGPGRIAVGNCSDQALLIPIEIRGDTVLDVDISSFVKDCPSVPF